VTEFVKPLKEYPSGEDEHELRCSYRQILQWMLCTLLHRFRVPSSVGPCVLPGIPVSLFRLYHCLFGTMYIHFFSLENHPFHIIFKSNIDLGPPPFLLD
jgi:hypothetical protein